MKPPEPPRGWIGIFACAVLSSLLNVLLHGPGVMLWLTVIIAVVAAIPCERWRRHYERWCANKDDGPTS